ncbi:thrombopoietin isoform X1 [Colossoma macropomum]|uniref:thrombopoietin isoform X1 n=1 Tax=Colossoma macropomum TaxID=42526 RepID=UPI001864B2BD|nr:thrombopoietin isoform X1 [Colossoma macropomum]
MDLSKVLLVLLSMVVSELPQVQSKPLDFVCDSEARRVMNKVKELEEDMVDCGAAASLPSPIRLPCIRVHKATWAKKSVRQRQAEVLLSLGSLVQDVRRAQAQSQPSCGLNLLERLERSISNYLHVLTQLHSEQGESESAQDPVCLGQNSQDFGVVLRHFDRLISGKLELLITDMAQAC